MRSEAETTHAVVVCASTSGNTRAVAESLARGFDRVEVLERARRWVLQP
jgi:hypothetical protein